MAVIQPKSGKVPAGASGRGKPILSIRARLIVVALVAVAPLMVERMRGLERARVQRTDLARAQVVDLVQSAVAAQRETVGSMRSLLQVIARAYARMPPDGEACNRELTALAGNITWLRSLSIAGADGRIKCTTDPRAAGLNVEDRPYFQNAMRTHDFVLSDYLISRLRQLPALIATYPLADDGTAGKGVVLALINLQWMTNLVETAARRADTSVDLIDGGGTLLAASAQQSDLIGTNFADRPLVRDMLGKEDGTMTTVGFDGMRRIFAYSRLPWTQARLAVGLDEAVVHAGIDHEMSVAYLQLAGFGALVLLCAWFGGERLIVRPIRSLAQMATRLGRGDLQVRATDVPWMKEFEPLAAAFDDMAHKLAVRDEELRIANQHLEELASLDGLTGLANRRGFDRQLEREWQRASERRKPLAMMMIDIDHFKSYNDRYGHLRGDACLRAVGETLSLVTLDDAVLVARYGGEEFALLLPGLDLLRTAALAEEARRAVADLLIAHDESPCGCVTVSVGVDALVPGKDQSPADLVEGADGALYAAKRRGRNAVVVNEPVALSAAS